MADIDPISSARRVNAYLRGRQDQSQIARLADGGFVVVWRSNGEDGSGDGIYGQRYDALGNAVGLEFAVNTQVSSDQIEPDVAAVGTGFVVTWRDQAGVDGSASSVKAQRFDAAAAKLGTETIVNTNTYGYQFTPAVAGNATGYVIAWTTDDSSIDGSGRAVRFQRYDAAGNALGAETTANISASGDQAYPVLAMKADGSFVLGWTDYGLGDGGEPILRRFNADGTPASGEIVVAGVSTGTQGLDTITFLADGRFVVGYSDYSGRDGYGNGAYARIFAADGTAGLDQLLTTAGASSSQNDVNIAATTDGGFVATWYDDGYNANSTNYYNVFVRAYDSAGAPKGLPKQIDSGRYYYSSEYSPRVIGLADGRVAVTWSGDYADPAQPGEGETTGIQLKLFAPTGSTALADPIGLVGLVRQVTIAENAANAALQIIEPPLAVSGLDGSGFAGGNVTVAPLSGWQASDQLGIRSDGNGIGQIGVSGSTVRYGGVTIGTITANGQNGAALTVALNGSASEDAVEALLQNIGFRLLTDSPAAVTRSVAYDVTAASGQSSGGQVVEISITPEADGFAQFASAPQLNAYRPNQQSDPHVAMLSGGGHVVAWISYDQDLSSWGVYAQRFTAAGVAIGPEFHVSQQTSGDQVEPSVLGLTDGGFLIAYTDTSGADGAGNGVFLRRYDAAGNAGAAFTITGASNQSQPQLAALPGGAYVVAYVSQTDGSDYGVYLRRFNADGTASDGGNARLVNTTTLYSQQDPSIATGTDGSLVVAWRSSEEDGYGYSIEAQRINADGSFAGGQFRVNQTTYGQQYQPSVAILAGGKFVVAWYDDQGTRVMARLYAANGTALTGEFQVNERGDFTQSDPQVVALAGGGFAIAYYQDSGDVLWRQFDANGVAVDSERYLDGAIYGPGQFSPAVAARADGGFLLAYEFDSQDGQSRDIGLVRIGAPGSTTPATQADPVISDFITGVTFGENLVNAAPQRIDPSVALTDPDSADFGGGRLVLSYQRGGGIEDQLGVANEGTGAGQLGVSGATVSYGGVTIGTISGGVNGANLVIDFTAAATVDAVERVLESLTYANTSSGPSTTPRSMSLVVSDGDGGQSASANFTISVTPEIDGIAVRTKPEQVNSYDPGAEVGTPRSFALADGGYVSVWTHQDGQDGSVYGVFAQRFDAQGRAVGGEFKVDALTDGYQYQPAGAGLTDGSFVVVWRDDAARDGSAASIQGRKYAADGTAGAQFQVNAATAGNQLEPSVVTLNGGGFAVAFASETLDGSGYGIALRRFDAAGAAIGTTDQQVNTTTDNSQSQVSIARAADGSFLLTWGGYGDGDSYGIFGQRFDATGAKAGAEFAVNQITAGSEEWPRAAYLQDGSFVVTWQSYYAQSLSARHYSANGTPLGDEFTVSIHSYSQNQPSVASLTGGGYVIGWYDGSIDRFVFREYSAGDAPIDDQRVLDGRGDGQYSWSREGDLLRLANGTIVATYRAYAPASDDNGIFQTLLNGAPIVRTAPTVSDFASRGDLLLSAVQGAGARIDRSVSVTFDGTLNGGRLLVTPLLNAAAGDTLSFASPSVSVTGAQLKVNGVQVGTISATANGSAGAPLAVTFNAAADAAAVQAVIEALTFSSPTIADGEARAISLRLFDAAGNTQAPPLDRYFTASSGVTVAAFDLADFTGDRTITEAALTAGPVVIDSSVDLIHGSGAGWTGGYVRLAYRNIALTDVRTTEALVLAPGKVTRSGNDVSYGGVTIATVSEDGLHGDNFTITFNAAATDLGVEAVIESLALSDASGAVMNQRDLTLRVQDANGAALERQFRLTVTPQTTTPAALGTEHIVNSDQYNTQEEIYTATLAGGGHVTVWRSYQQDGSDWGVFSQRFAADGSPVGPEQRVNQLTFGTQYDIAVDGLADGGYVIAWRSQGGSTDNYSDIRARRYDASGNATGGEFTVAANFYYQYSPVVIGLNGGGFVIAWRDDDYTITGNAPDIRATRYDASGVALQSGVIVNTGQLGDQVSPSGIALAGGGYAIAWDGPNPANTETGVYLRLFNGDGSAITANDVRLNDAAINYYYDRYAPRMAQLTGGNIAVVFYRDGDLWSRIVSPAGAVVGSEARITPADMNGVSDGFDIAATPDGGFAVAYVADPAAYEEYKGVFVQRFNASAAAIDGPLRVSADGGQYGYQSFYGDVQQVALVAEGGDLVVSWRGYRSSDETGTSSYDVIQQRVSAVASTNADPVIGDVARSVTFLEDAVNAGPQRIDTAITLTDADSANFAGGQIVLSLVAGYDSYEGAARTAIAAQDSLSFVTTGTGVARVEVAGGVLSVGGVAIGTISANGQAGAALVVDLNASATASRVERALEAIAYANPLSNPAATRTYALRVTDGDGGSTVTQLIDVNVTPQPDGLIAATAPRVVNSVTSGSQNQTAIAALANGTHALVWSSDNRDGWGRGIALQISGLDGRPIGPEIVVNTVTPGDQTAPSVVGLADGSLVVAWRRDDGNIGAQRFTATGSAIGGEFLLNEAGTSSTGPALVATGTGFVATFLDNNRVVARSFDSSGAPLGGEVQLSSGSNGAYAVRAAVLADGRVQIAWTDYSYPNYRLMTATLGNGVPVETVLATGIAETNNFGLAANGNGFVATWSAYNDGSSYGVAARRYDASGAALGDVFRVNTTSNSSQYAPSVVSIAGGGFVIAWQDDNNSYDSATAFQQYDASGVAVDGEQRAEQSSQFYYYGRPVLAPTANGFVIAFETQSSTSNSVDIVQRTYGPAVLPVSAAPVITGLDSTITVTEAAANAAPVRLDSSIAVFDSDSADFAGGQLQVYRVSGDDDYGRHAFDGERGQDQIGIADFAGANGAITVSGATVSYLGTTIGTITTGQDGRNGRSLTIDLTAGATAPAIKALIENLSYSNALSDPRPSRTLAIRLADGDGGWSDPVTATVQITPQVDGAQPYLGQVKVNQYNPGTQAEANIARLADKSFVVAFQDQSGRDGSGYGIYFRKVDADGNPTGLDVAVNTTTDYDQSNPRVAALTDGGFVVTWQSYTPYYPAYTETKLQRYDATGTAVGGEVSVSDPTIYGSDTTPQITGLANGGWVVTWSIDTNIDGSGATVLARIYDPAGTASAPFVVEQLATNGQQAPQVVALADGGVAFSWATYQAGNWDIATRIYAANGTPRTGEIAVASFAGEQYYNSIAALKDGSYVIAYQDATGRDSSGSGIYVQRVSAAGDLLGQPARVNSTTYSEQTAPRIAALDTGGFVVVWDGNYSGTGYVYSRVFAQQFDAAGNRIDGEILLDNPQSYYDGNYDPTVVGLDNGGFAIAWHGYRDETGSTRDYQILLQRFANSAAALSGGAVSGAEDTDIVLGRNLFVANFTDPQGDPLVSVKITNLPSDGQLLYDGAPVAAGTTYTLAQLDGGRLIYRPTHDFNGVTQFGWSGSDGNGYAPSPVFAVVTVTPVNDPVGLIAGGPGNGQEAYYYQTSFARTITYTDPDGQPIQLTVDWGDGSTPQVYTGSGGSIPIAHRYADSGVYQVAISATDFAGSIENGNFAVNIANVAPTIPLYGNSTVPRGQVYTLSLAGIADPGDDTVSRIVIDWGDGTTQTFDRDPSTGFPSNVTRTYATIGTYTIRATLTDEDGTYANAGTRTIDVQGVTASVGVSGNINEGPTSQISVTISNFGVPAGDTVQSLRLDWGDGTIETIANPDTTQPLTRTRTFPDGAKTIDVRVYATDNYGETQVGPLSQVRNIYNVAPTAQVVAPDNIDQNVAFNLTVSNKVDPGTDTLTQLRIDWGDGTPNTVVPSVADLVQAAVQAKTYTAAPGYYTIRVYGTDEDGEFLVGQRDIRVRPGAITGTVSGASSVNEGDDYAVTVSNVQTPTGTTVQSITADWGNGVTETINTPNVSQPIVFHRVQPDGTILGSTVTISVNDGTSTRVLGTKTFDVYDVAPTLSVAGAASVQEGSAYTLTLSNFRDPGADTLSAARIDWGDGQQTNLTSFNFASAQAISHVFNGGGTTPAVKVYLTNEDGTFLVGSRTVSVTGADPTATISAPSAVNEGQQFTLNINNFQIPPSDTVSSITVDWGDGSQPFVISNPSAGSYAPIHVYRDNRAIAYTATVTAATDDGPAVLGTATIAAANVAPTATVSAPNAVNQNASFDLTVSNKIDPGTDTLSSVRIVWGDGTETTATTADLATALTRSKTYGTTGNFTIQVFGTDEDGEFLLGQRGVTVNPSLIARPDAVGASEDGTTLIATSALLANDSGNAQFASVDATSAAGATLSVQGGNIAYNPGGLFQSLRAGQTGADSFTYQVNDGAGHSASTTVTVAVAGANDAPTAVADTISTYADGTTSVAASQLLLNDTDPDAGDTKALQSVSATSTKGGTVSFANGQVVYNPGSAFAGLSPGATSSDTFTYTMVDGSGATSSATVTVNVTGRPVALDVSNVTAPARLSETAPSVVGFDIALSGPASLQGVVNVDIYASFDSILGASDVLLTTIAVPVADAYASAHQNVTISAANAAALPFGSYHLIANATLVPTNLIASANDVEASTGVSLRNPGYSAIVDAPDGPIVAGQPVVLTGSVTRNDPGASLAFVPVVVSITHNGGTQTLNATTNASGQFTATFNSLAGAGGVYTVAARNPANAAEDATFEDSFDLVSLDVVEASVNLAVNGAIARTGSITLHNQGDATLTGLNYAVSGLNPGWSFSVDPNAPTSVGGYGYATVNYSLTAPAGTSTDDFTLTVGSAQGASDSTAFHVTAKPVAASLSYDASLLTRSVLRGGSTYVEFKVTNTGQDTAHGVSLALPQIPWLSASGSNLIGDLAGGASKTVSLLLNPGSTVPLNHYAGNFVLSSAETGQAAVGFDFNVTSDRKGNLALRLTDEGTYIGANHSLVNDATVRIFDSSTNALVYSSNDVDGTLNLQLKEGTYRLQIGANKHANYQATIKIPAGGTRSLDAFLPVDGIKYTWTVTETTIQDHYSVHLDSTFETDVPIPVITMDPAVLDFSGLDEGQSRVVNVTLTNQGIIQVDQVKLDLPDPNGYTVTPQVDKIDLIPAHGSVVVPVTITRNPAGLMALNVVPVDDSDGPVSTLNAYGCGIYGFVAGTIGYHYECGPDGVYRSAPLAYDGLFVVGAPCVPNDGPTGIYFVDGTGDGGGGGFGIIDVGLIYLPPPSEETTDIRCTPPASPLNVLAAQPAQPLPSDFYERSLTLLNGVTLTVVVGESADARAAFGTLKSAVTAGTPGTALNAAAKNGLQHAADTVAGVNPGANALTTLIGTVAKTALSAADNNDTYRAYLANILGTTLTGGSSPTIAELEQQVIDTVDPRFDGLVLQDDYARRQLTQINFDAYMTGDLRWFDTADPAGLQAMLAYAANKIGTRQTITAADLPVPSDATPAMVQAFVDRFNRTIAYWNAGVFTQANVPAGQNSDFIASDVLLDLYERVAGPADATSTQAQALQAQDDKLTHDVKASLNEIVIEELKVINGVCVKVKIRLDQDAVLTRQAFIGTLTIEATNEPVDNINLVLQVKDANGNVVAANIFNVTNTSLTGVAALDGTGDLLVGQMLTAQFQFVPSSLAAPTGPTTYSIGGILTTENHDTHEVYTIDLSPADVTVQPQPELTLNYFQERNVIGDDPHTTQVEASKPFLLGVQVRNDGAGVAKDLHIDSAQPQIVENEKGLDIGFQILGSQVQGTVTPGSLKADFGDVAAGAVRTGAWYLQSSLQGKFIDYKASFEHVNPFGGIEYSLIKQVNIHELIHGGEMTGDDGTDFFTNEDPDPQDAGDTLYLSTGAVVSVATIAATAATQGSTGNTLTVRITPTGKNGNWQYLDALAANSSYTLTSVARGDGTQLLAGQFWFTDRTFSNASTYPVYEDRLHILDNQSTTSYVATFAQVVAPPTAHATGTVTGNGTTPEGATYALTVSPTAGQSAAPITQLRIDWGDGSMPQIVATMLSGPLALNHVFADGNASPTVTVYATDAQGEFVFGTRTLDVANVAPTSMLSGATSVVEDQPYTLTIGTKVDPGTDTLTQVSIDWGDGSAPTVVATALASALTQSHVYADPAASRTITVSGTDEDGTFVLGTRVIGVTANTGQPSASISGAGSTPEGASYALTIGAASGPGSGSISQARVDWGDGSTPTVVATTLAAPLALSHVYADGNAARTISVYVTDADGEIAIGSKPVTVANVAPIASVLGAANVAEGSTYTLSIGAKVDPGADTLTSISIDWGDGSTPTVVTTALASALTQTHVYADGNATRAITVTGTDEDGTFTLGTTSVNVTNVAPTASITGAASVAEGSAYTLNIGAKVDPGADTLSSVSIDWGDGSTPTVVTTALATALAQTHIYSDGNATRAITVTGTDEDGTFTLGTTSVNVTNVAPTASITGAATVAEGSSYTLTIGAKVDPGADTLSSISIDWGDGSALTTVSTALAAALTQTHVYADGNATRAITVTGTDEDGTFTLGTTSVNVTNVAPTAAVTGVASVAEGSAYTLNIGAKVDPGVDTLSSISIDWGDGSALTTVTTTLAAALTQTHIYADGNAPRTITVTGTDEDGTFTLGTTSVNVTNVAPTATLSGATSVVEDQPYSLTIGAKVDPGTDTLTSVSIDWGDGSAPTVVATALASALTQTHVYADPAAARTITVSGTDEDGTFTLGTRVIGVTAGGGGGQPTASISGADTTPEGSSYALTIGAASGPGSGSISQVRVDWGDGTTPTVVATTLASSQSLSHTYADGNAARTILVYATDADGEFALGSKPVGVLDVAPSATIGGAAAVNEGATYTLSVGAKVDPGTDTVTQVRVAWGDGSPDTLVTTALTAPLALDHVFADGANNRTIQVFATDEDGEHAIGSKLVAVANVAPTATVSGAASVAEGSAYTLNIGAKVDPGADTLTAISIDWGDGSTPTVVTTALATALAQTHIYADGNATRAITVTGTDEDGTFTLGTTSVNLTNVAPTASVTGAATVAECSAYTLNIGAKVDPGADTLSSISIDWGDGSALTTVTTTLAAALTQTHVYADGNAPRTITVTGTDEDGTFTLGTTSVSVTNVAPTASVTGAASVAEGSAYTLNIGAKVDPGADTLASLSIDWGDGSTPTTVATTLAAALSRTHVYADNAAAPRTITVTGTDEDGTFTLGTTSVNVTNVAPTASVTGAASVAEGATYTLAISAKVDPGADTLTSLSIDWGDGSAPTTVVGTLADALTRTHVYADDAAAPRTITVTGTDEDGTFTLGTTSVTVTNIAPTATVAGATAVNEGASYALTVSNKIDPGADTLTSVRVDWGDGAGSTQATSLAAAANFSHVYADGTAARTITVYGTDEDGEFVLGTKAITVNNVAPSIALTGANHSGAGWSWLLGLGAVSDPGTDTVNRYTVDWGDGSAAQIFDAPGLPSNLAHVFASAGTYTVSVGLRDEDGSFAAAGTLSVKVDAPDKIGDGPSVVTRESAAQMTAAWTRTGYTITHKANFQNGSEAWSAVTLTTTGGTTLAGGDLLLGDLGVSGQSLNTGGNAQEIDGTEALRFQLANAADGLRFNLTRFTAENGGQYLEAGRVQLYRNGALVGEQAFEASASGTEKVVTIFSNTAFDEVVFEAGDTNGAGQFRPGGMASGSNPSTFGSDAISTTALKLGSEYTLDWLETTLVANAPASMSTMVVAQQSDNGGASMNLMSATPQDQQMVDGINSSRIRKESGASVAIFV